MRFKKKQKSPSTASIGTSLNTLLVCCHTDPIYMQKKQRTDGQGHPSRSSGLKHDKSNMTPKYGDISIERVKEYTYLGVIFAEVPNFYLAKTSFFTKAKNASAQLSSFAYCTKMNNFESHLTLFNSLVRSTLMYCTSVWGLNYIQEVETFRIGFLKKLFLLPKVTPAWFLRLELETGNSEIFFIKQIAKFWLRIILLDKESLVYKCYEAVKNLKCRTYNWYNDF